MNLVFFVHSLVSDWNNGNAHFSRGIISELASQGHRVTVFEPAGGWSLENLIASEGRAHLDGFCQAYPELRSETYHSLDMPAMCAGADAVIVHEWNPPELLREAAAYVAAHPQTVLLFHDTHHRAVSDPGYFARLDLSGFDGVLAYGRSLARVYESKLDRVRVWVWHEAADIRRFHPRPYSGAQRDLVWVGNWGDEERAEEIVEFLVEPVRRLHLRATVYGVRYPQGAREKLQKAGIEYGGWLPNYRVPEVFAQFRFTVHIPRGPYVSRLPGIPTIRVFEALACGIPLVSAPWPDDEGLFSPGKDFLTAKDGDEMAARLEELKRSAALANAVREHGLKTVRERHTCRQRVDELLQIVRETQRHKRF
ncbi:MAG: glycosyltransferase [Verrucomicrobia bacterium]|nr:glycosyltransferase [Verrucomicrobiota bacterium]